MRSIAQLAERPDDWAALSERSRFLFEHGTTDEADKALRALIERRPEDASAHHNRGVLLMKAQRHAEAVEEYRESFAIARTAQGPTSTWATHLRTAAASTRPPPRGSRLHGYAE